MEVEGSFQERGRGQGSFLLSKSPFSSKGFRNLILKSLLGELLLLMTLLRQPLDPNRLAPRLGRVIG